ncbi:MAG: MmgE/PrpD family protein, partial [Burkholderiales bacterium]
ANFAGGLREYVDAGTEESPFQAGFAARNGLYVADLISQGLSAARTALHGNAGFYRAFAEENIEYGKRLVEDIGRQFEFTTVTYKQYPACQFLRGLIRGLGELSRRAEGVEPESIELRMNPYEADFIGVRFAGPFTSATQTVMSAPFCSALAWVTGTASFDGLRTYDDGRVLALVRRTAVISDASRERYEPHIRVVLQNGSVLEWEERAGDSNYRVTWEAAVQMAQQLCEEVGVPVGRARHLTEVVANVEDEQTVERLVGAVCAAATA